MSSPIPSRQGDAASGRPPNWEPLLEQPAFTPTRRMRVVCVGAGHGGLMVAYKIQQELKLEKEIDLVIYEKNPDIGGTWYENTYPGAACDFPSHAYVFPFEGNPDWSRFYAGQKEILAYIHRTADKYDLRKHVQLNAQVREAIWDEDSAQWKIKIEQNGQVISDEADFFISCAGFLNKWQMPDIQGLEDFKGKLVHTAAWDNEYDWAGKKIAVIGNGASGLQIVPQLQRKAAKVVNYVRQPTWITDNFLSDREPSKGEYTEEQKQKWREDPQALHAYRKELEQGMNMFFFAMLVDHPVQHLVKGMCEERMKASTPDDPALRARMTPPKFLPGCRRITTGDGYLEALQQPNCRDCWDPIERVTATGIRTVAGGAAGGADGEQKEEKQREEEEEEEEEERFDMIVCATGFDSSYLPGWKMVGRDGATLEAQWRPDPYAFLATQVDGFPNYGMLNGPNAAVQHGNVLAQMWWTAGYLVRWVTRMARHDMASVCVRRAAVADYNAYAGEFLQRRTVWAGACRTRYKNGRAEGRVVGLYPGSMMHLKNALDQVDGSDFDITYRSRNRFRCLGNGLAASDENGAGDLAPYY
ncbi:hypothetical protein F4778DRAFT_795946 [Xylariomycetidae sp. FL2044]|nr:hypothetical protein F4778DRAFT_795946 [Xylariomycetidae sp. FL2044]